MATLYWEVLEKPEPPKCNKKRGPKSKITCERDAEHKEFHAGRGKLGYWFFWY